MSSWSFRSQLSMVTLAGIVFQIIYVILWQHDYDVAGDAYFYHEAGQLLADGFGWIHPLVFETWGIEQQSADHPPLYIAFIALISSGGFRSELSHMVLTSLVFGTAVIASSGVVGRMVAGRRSGLIAAGLVGFYPGVWGWHGTILSEPTAMLGVLVVAISCYRWRQHPTWVRAASCGAAVTLAVFGRAEFMLLGVCVVLPVMVADRSLPPIQRGTHLMVAGAVSVGTLAPWIAFNLSRFEETVLVSEGFPVTLATANCDLTYFGPDTGYWHLDCANGYLADAGLTLENSTQPQRSAAMQDGAIKYIRDNADRVPTVLLARWMRITGIWNPLRQAGLDAIFERRDIRVTQAAHLSFLALAPAAVTGAMILRRRKVPIAPLVGALVAVLVTVTVTFGQSRYRASVEPVIAILAAVAVNGMADWWRQALSDARSTANTDSSGDVEERTPSIDPPAMSDA